MASIELVDIRKSFGAVEVVKGVNVSIQDGEFVALVGPSGCGKSTLLRAIAGLEAVSGGEIRIDGRVVNTMPPKDRDIAMVFQNYALYPHMTVQENMAFSLKLKGIPKVEAAERVQKAAAILTLEPFLDRYPRQLSGGQRQRVAMGRAIVRNPVVFLFDEPLSNLDAKLRVQMRTEIKELYQRLGTTMVYVTHDQIEAMTMADRIVVMHDGNIEQVGAPLDVYDRPENLFVAGFIGSPAINLFSGHFSVTDRGAVFQSDMGLAVPVPAIPNGYHERKCVLGMRPEHVELDPDGVIELAVKVVEPTGSETFLIGEAGNETIRCLFRDRIERKPKDRIRLSLPPARMLLYDHASGLRIERDQMTAPT